MKKRSNHAQVERPVKKVQIMAKLTKLVMTGKVKVNDLTDISDDGIHCQIYKQAHFLRCMEMSETEAIRLIYERFNQKRRRRPLQTNEVENAVKNAYNQNESNKLVAKRKIIPPRFEKITPGSFWNKRMPQPTCIADPRLIRMAIESSPWTMEQMHSESPQQADSMSPLQIIRRLFDLYELLCCGSVARFSTRTLEEWGNGGWMGDQIVPNPSRVRQGWTMGANPRLSAHTRDSTGKRKFIVVESDDKSMTFDEKASVLRYLRDKVDAHLRMVVHTGGKSLHGWFEASQDESVNFKFMKLACRLGADRRMWLPEQLARLPNAVRIKNQNIQKCYYLNP